MKISPGVIGRGHSTLAGYYPFITPFRDQKADRYRSSKSSDEAAEDMGPIPVIRDAVNEKDRSSEIRPH